MTNLPVVGVESIRIITNLPVVGDESIRIITNLPVVGVESIRIITNLPVVGDESIIESTSCVFDDGSMRISCSAASAMFAISSHSCPVED